MSRFIKSLLFIILFFIAISHSLASERGKRDGYNIRISELQIRDPFVYADSISKTYYMYANGGDRILCYKSKDLENWKYCGNAFLPNANFWGKHDFWAPDVYCYNNLYYMFTTFSASNIKRGTSIMVAKTPYGPFDALVNEAITPKEWMSLDGSLFFDKNSQPWVVFCHEWIEVRDGEIYAQRLACDLKTTIGDPVLLFKASCAPWVGSYRVGDKDCYITDAPFIWRLDTGELIMTWSSFNKDSKYAIGQAISRSGSIEGPWEHNAESLNNDDGGHAMIFRDFNGNLKISYHAPNSAPERPMIKSIVIKDGRIQY